MGGPLGRYSYYQLFQFKKLPWQTKDLHIKQVPTEESTIALKNNYKAYPIVRIQENVYSATLGITNIELDEADYQHYLQIRHPDINTPKEHW